VTVEFVVTQRIFAVGCGS